MNKTVLRVTTLFILLLAIILLPSITSAETNSIIVKQTKDYIIYNESMMNEEFTFAFSDTNEKTNLIFFLNYFINTKLCILIQWCKHIF